MYRLAFCGRGWCLQIRKWKVLCLGTSFSRSRNVWARLKRQIIFFFDVDVLIAKAVREGVRCWNRFRCDNGGMVLIGGPLIFSHWLRTSKMRVLNFEKWNWILMSRVPCRLNLYVFVDMAYTKLQWCDESGVRWGKWRWFLVMKRVSFYWKGLMGENMCIFVAVFRKIHFLGVCTFELNN